MRTHECWYRGCHELCTPGHDYCSKHEQEHKQAELQRLHEYHQTEQYHQYHNEWQRIYNEEQRDPVANAFYHSTQWTKLRDYVKLRDMMIDGSTGKALSDHDYIVDHIIPRKYCDNPFDESNLWLLSKSQHNRKTLIEQAIAKKPGGANKLRHISRKTWRKWLNEKKPKTEKYF